MNLNNENTEVPSIGEQLEIVSQMKKLEYQNSLVEAKMKEIEYQNSLVMKSLEIYNAKFEQLKKEQTELLKALLNSNQILASKISEEVSRTQGAARNVVEGLNSEVNNKIKACIQNMQQLTSQAKNTYIALFQKRDRIDMLVIGVSAMSLFTLIVLVWKVFHG